MIKRESERASSNYWMESTHIWYMYPDRSRRCELPWHLPFAYSIRYGFID